MTLFSPILNEDLRRFLARSPSTPDNIRIQNEQPPSQFSNFTILRLEENFALDEDIKDLQTLAEINQELRPLVEFLERQGVTGEPLILNISVAELKKIEQQAASASKRPQKGSLRTFWRLETRQFNDEEQEKLVRILNSDEFPGVRTAYRELAAFEPSLSGAPTREQTLQFYRCEGPYGVDADWTYAKPILGGQGDNIQCGILERGLWTEHQELDTVVDTTLISGDIHPDLDVQSHGTSVAAIICGRDDTTGVLGIAPRANPVRLASHYRASSDSSGHVAEAIEQAIMVLKAGDVLTLEVQRANLPVEVDEADAIAIQQAIDLGIIVIEAAGNGDQDLRNHPAFSDGEAPTEAILVAASMIMEISDSGPAGHTQWTDPGPEGSGQGSNYGSFIHCFAPGERVSTASAQVDGIRNPAGYTDNFGGTSAATAIIAGVALVTQSMHVAMNKPRLNHYQMKAILSDSALGTKALLTSPPIGSMPDLRKISQYCGFCPIPSMLTLSNTFCEEFDTSPIGLSPDILTSLKNVKQPGLVFGDRTQFGDGFLDNASVVVGQENSVYVRLRNRVDKKIENVIATVYSAPLSSLITPDDLIEIGRSRPITVPGGCNPVVTNAILWKPESPIGEGRTLIVQLSTAPETIRPLPEMQWLELLATLCNSEQVAQRSIQVVEVADSDSSVVELPFFIKGVPDGRSFNLNIRRQLPEEIDLQLEVPQAVFDAIAQTTCIDDQDIERRPKTGQVRFRLPAFNQITFPKVSLPASQSYPVKLLARGRTSFGFGERYSIAVRQVSEGNELGRITFALRPPKPPMPSLRQLIDWVRQLFG
ncbi:MAG: S8 family serine peptidase [Cyanobacteria bacterium P01_F01_bin.150]